MNTTAQRLRAMRLNLVCLMFFGAALMTPGCSSTKKPSTSYPVTTFVDPVSEEAPHVTID